MVCQARAGERESLERLLEANWPWLKGLAYNVLGNMSDVDDALQNICALVIEKIGTLREPERFKPWLATLARREALAYRKKLSRWPITLDEGISENIIGEGGKSVVERVAGKEQYQKLLESVKNLPEKYREVFMLKYSKEITYSEISEILDIPVTTVQIRLVRARRMIYNRLTGKPCQKVPRT